MRLVVVLSLSLLAVIALPACLFAARNPKAVTCTAAPRAEGETCAPSPLVDAAPAAKPLLPPEWLWPGGLFIGYISMSLKEQLRRRGHNAADRSRTFSDLIHLPPRNSTDASDQAEPSARKGGQSD